MRAEEGFNLDKVIEDLPVPVEYAYAGVSWGALTLMPLIWPSGIPGVRGCIGSSSWAAPLASPGVARQRPCSDTPFLLVSK